MLRITEEQRLALLAKYGGENTDEFVDDVCRIENGEPFEYVLGHTKFLGANIDLSLRPMIPRPETAFWVNRALDELAEISHPLRIADTFSGSGNVGIAVLKHLPNAFVEFSEFDEKLLKQIRINCELNGIPESRYVIKKADGLSALTGAYDAIFAVPPYVAREALPDLDAEMIHHEPHLAFFADDNGTAFHRMLIRDGYKFLKNGGTLYMEADMDQDIGIRNMVHGTPWKKLELWEDPYGATPNIVLRK